MELDKDPAKDTRKKPVEFSRGAAMMKINERIHKH